MTETEARKHWHDVMDDRRRENADECGKLLNAAMPIEYLDDDLKAWRLHGSSCGQDKKSIIDDLVDHLNAKGFRARNIGGAIAVDSRSKEEALEAMEALGKKNTADGKDAAEPARSYWHGPGKPLSVTEQIEQERKAQEYMRRLADEQRRHEREAVDRISYKPEPATTNQFLGEILDELKRQAAKPKGVEGFGLKINDQITECDASYAMALLLYGGGTIHQASKLFDSLLSSIRKTVEGAFRKAVMTERSWQAMSRSDADQFGEGLYAFFGEDRVKALIDGIFEEKEAKNEALLEKYRLEDEARKAAEADAVKMATIHPGSIDPQSVETASEAAAISEWDRDRAIAEEGGQAGGNPDASDDDRPF